MSKRLVLIIIFILLLSSIICFLGYKNINQRIAAKGGLKTGGFTYTMADNNGKSEYNYSIKITNTNGKAIFIKKIEPYINETIINKILSKDTVIVVNRNLNPNESIWVTGQLSVDTKGLFLQDIVKNMITDIKVTTEENVSIK